MCKTVFLGRNKTLSLADFYSVVYEGAHVAVDEGVIPRLKEQRRFVDYLLENNIKVYGLTTGFADLRNKSVSPNQAAQLSKNILESHDAGIGAPFSADIVLGAMLVRANSLCKGYSAISLDAITTLIQMINCKIIPLIPSTGSLGASGDLAFLARLGRAMQGKEDVKVLCEGTILSSKEAFAQNNIQPFSPKAKDGLALTNGTAFMASMMSLAMIKQMHLIENILSMQGLFLNAVEAIDAAFSSSMQNVRGQTGQILVAEVLRRHFEDSPFIDRLGIQNDYCIRCLPQLLGPRIEVILEQYSKIIRELNAVTDNPLIFKGEEISDDLSSKRRIVFEGEDWAVISGGNFHGETITASADALLAANAKIALILERQMTYLLNPARNESKLPVYLIASDQDAGLSSGFMITQYTANALAQKISSAALPCSMFNITSANECEDIVSYGATAAQKLLDQITLAEQLCSIYLTVTLQAYSIRRQKRDGSELEGLIAEKIFNDATLAFDPEYAFPLLEDIAFDKIYAHAVNYLASDRLSLFIGQPLRQMMNNENSNSRSSEVLAAAYGD